MITDRLHGRPIARGVWQEVFNTGARRNAQGIGLPAIVEAHKLWGMRLLSEVHDLDPSLRPEMGALGPQIFEHLEQSLGILINGYVHAAQSTTRHEEDEEARLVRGLCLGTVPPAEALQALGLRYTAVESCGVVICSSVDASSSWPMNNLRAILKAAFSAMGYACLNGVLRGDLVSIYSHSGSRPAAMEHIKSRLLQSLNALAGSGGLTALLITVSEPRSTLDEIPHAYREARELLRVARAFKIYGLPLSQHDLIVQSMVISRIDLAKKLVDLYLGPLLDHDRRFRGCLVETLRTYLGCNGHIKEASKSLHVHPNTLLYRLRKIAQIIGRDIRDGDRWVELRLALWAWETGLARPRRLTPFKNGSAGV